MKELILRTLTGILLIILVAGSILLGPLPFLGILMLIYYLAVKELLLVYNKDYSVPLLVMTISGALLLPMSYMVLQYQWSPFWYLLPSAIWIIGFSWSRFMSEGVLALFWLAIPLTSFYLLGWVLDTFQFQTLFPLAVIALVWINDTFAYVVGRLFGKHKLTPRLSPGKTWEGFLGGILFTLAGGWIIFLISGEFTLGSWFLFSLLIGSLGLVGDLFESSLKRKKNIKNMGELLPGHGGILDRFDSLLFVAPALLILLILLNLIQ